jgi:hypothetical protein
VAGSIDATFDHSTRNPDASEATPPGRSSTITMNSAPWKYVHCVGNFSYSVDRP